MLNVRTTNKFEKDSAKIIKRGKNIAKLKKIILELVSGKTLDKKYRDHKLIGNFDGSRECHIEPDWLLIYEVSKNELILKRTGTHADLFE